MDEKLLWAIQMMKEGKEEGFNYLYSATYNYVYFRAKMYTNNNEEDALDLVQIVYIEVYNKINSLESPESLFAWLKQITFRQSTKLLAKNKDQLLTEEGEGVFEILETEDVSVMPEMSADAKATGEIIAGLINELEEKQRAAIVAYYYDEFSIKQIAEMYGCPEGTVKSWLNYGRKNLEKKIKEKEEKEGYRLHVFSLPLLIYAIRFLSEKSVLSAHVAEGVYVSACTKLGIGVVEGVAVAATTAGTAVSGTVAAATTTNTVASGAVVSAGKGIGLAAKFASLGAGAKALVIAGALAATATVGGLTYVAVSDIGQPTESVVYVGESEEIETTDNTEETTPEEIAITGQAQGILMWPADYFLYKNVDDTYYACTGFSKKGYEEYLKYKDEENVTLLLPGEDAEGNAVQGFCFVDDLNVDISVLTKANLNITCPDSYSYYNVISGESYYSEIIKTIMLGEDFSHIDVGDYFAHGDYLYMLTQDGSYGYATTLEEAWEIKLAELAEQGKTWDDVVAEYAERGWSEEEAKNALHLNEKYFVPYSPEKYWSVYINTAVTDKNQTAYGTILESINNIPVTTLKSTFRDCDSLVAEGIPKIPDTITNMNSTFAFCDALVDLSDVVIPDSVTNLRYCFGQSKNITDAPKLPSNVTDIGYLFLFCGALVNGPSSIPSTVVNMDEAFNGCKSLVVAPDMSNAVNVVDMRVAFGACEKIVLPPDLSACNKVENMRSAFSNCKSLTVAPVIPATVKEMDYVFNRCTLIEGTIVINANPTTYKFWISKNDFEAKNITLTGDSAMLDTLGAQGLNYCPECNGKCVGSH